MEGFKTGYGCIDVIEAHNEDTELFTGVWLIVVFLDLTKRLQVVQTLKSASRMRSYIAIHEPVECPDAQEFFSPSALCSAQEQCVGRLHISLHSEAHELPLEGDSPCMVVCDVIPKPAVDLAKCEERLWVQRRGDVGETF